MVQDVLKDSVEKTSYFIDQLGITSVETVVRVHCEGGEERGKGKEEGEREKEGG